MNDPKWPSDADEAAIEELVALGDSLEPALSGKQLVELFLSVEAILSRHDRNPRKLIDAIDHLAKWAND